MIWMGGKAMAGNWRACHWGDLATLEYGKGIRDYRSGAGRFRVYGTNGPIGWYPEALYQSAGVIVGRKGAYRGVYYSPDPFYAIDTAFYLVPKVEFDPRWAYYQLLTQDINGMDSGSAIPSTSRESFYHLPVLFPPLSEQRAIAAILGALDDKIELNRQMNHTLEAMAQALFQSWFVDFDPVRAKLAGRQPAGMDAETGALFPETLDERSDGMPQGWKICGVGDIVGLRRESLDPEEYPEEVFDHYSIPAFDASRMPIQQHGREIKSDKLAVPADSVLLSKLNPRIPRVWLPAVNEIRRSICSTEFLVLVPKPPATSEFVFLLCQSGPFATAFATLVTGTSGSHQRVQPDHLLRMRIILPPPAIIRRLSDFARPLLRRAFHNLAESQHIAALRDALLPKLLSGEVRLPEAERMVGAAP